MKTLLKVIAGVLAAALIVYGVGWCITGNYDPTKWGNRAEQETPAGNDEDKPAEGGTATAVVHTHNHALSASSDEETDENAGIALYASLPSVPSECPDCGASGTMQFNDYVIKPTCTASGSARYSCNECGGGFKEYYESATGHRYSWVISTAPTKDTPGVASYKCSRCSEVTDTRAVYALPDEPEKEGYHFVGWYFDEAFTRPYDNSPIYSDTQLHAKFEINVYTVTFDSNGGSAVESQQVNWNESLTLTSSEREGYNFLGWYLSDGTKFEGQAIKENTTLTAHWQIKTFTVRFYVNGALYTSMTVEYGTALSAVADAARVFANNIISFQNANGETPDVDPSGMVVSDDMIVLANEPSLKERVTSSTVVPIVIVAAGALFMIATCVMITGKTSKRKD